LTTNEQVITVGQIYTKGCINTERLHEIQCKQNYRRKIKQKKADKQDKSPVLLSHIIGSTNSIPKILKQHDLNIIFDVKRKIWQIVRTIKNKIPLDQGVNEIP